MWDQPAGSAFSFGFGYCRAFSCRKKLRESSRSIQGRGCIRVASLSAFSGLLRSNKDRIVLGSPARKIVMDDVPWYLALDASVGFVWRPFFGVIESTNQDAMSMRATHSKRTATVGAEATLKPCRRSVIRRHPPGEPECPLLCPMEPHENAGSLAVGPLTHSAMAIPDPRRRLSRLEPYRSTQAASCDWQGLVGHDFPPEYLTD